MKANEVPDVWADDAKPGDFEWIVNAEGDRAGMAVRCPGCGSLAALPFEGTGPRWTWDGNRESPTLSPSVHHTAPECGWHGWLRNGEFAL